MAKKCRKKCLLVGAGGFIGSHLLEEIKDDWDIFALSNQRPNIEQGRRVNWLTFDLTDNLDIKILPPRIDTVIYLAQSEYYKDFPRHAVDMFHINTFSVLQLLEYARSARAHRFILASSGGVRVEGHGKASGDAEKKPHDEKCFYLDTKWFSEILAEYYKPYMYIIILRFFFVYGPCQRRSMLIPRLVECVRKRKPIILQGRYGIGINPTHISDAVRALERSTHFDKSLKFDIAGPKVYSLYRIGCIIGKALGREPVFNIETGKEPKNITGDISKMAGLIGPPRIRFEDGVKDLV